MATHSYHADRSTLYAEEGVIRVERSAFDHIEHGSRLVIVGITPGAQQRNLADAAFAHALAKGATAAAAARAAKFAASFGGAMRTNLVRMLDLVGAASLVGLGSMAEAFVPSTQSCVHFTSALRYPVFFNGANYNGQTPMLSSPVLRSMVETLLVDEVRQLPGAVWQPLGERPLAALKHLISLGVLQPNQLAPVLPHPSGANNERISFFLGEKPEDSLSSRTNARKISAQRDALITFYAKRIGAAR